MATEAKSSVPFLHLQGVNAFYGESHILHGVDLVVNQGELVTLLGRNGAGRTTTNVYDKRSRKTSETNAAGEKTEFTYDGVGNLLTTKSPLEHGLMTSMLPTD